MPLSTALQIVLGLLIPLQLISHIIHTRVAHEIYGVNDEMGYIIILMWPSTAVWMQSLLLLIVWVHGCIGLHMWLRLTVVVVENRALPDRRCGLCAVVRAGGRSDRGPAHLG